MKYKEDKIDFLKEISGFEFKEQNLDGAMYYILEYIFKFNNKIIFLYISIKNCFNDIAKFLDIFHKYICSNFYSNLGMLFFDNRDSNILTINNDELFYKFFKSISYIGDLIEIINQFFMSNYHGSAISIFLFETKIDFNNEFSKIKEINNINKQKIDLLLKDTKIKIQKNYIFMNRRYFKTFSEMYSDNYPYFHYIATANNDEIGYFDKYDLIYWIY